MDRISKKFEEGIRQHREDLHPIVPLGKGDKVILLDFTGGNPALTPEVIGDTERFSAYVNGLLEAAGATYGTGGYAEHRTIYRRSHVFDTPGPGEDRRFHLGADVWGPAGTPVYAPLEATVHSFAFNDAFGDYGATLILQHELEGVLFHTLYGHLSLHSIQDLREGQDVEKGQWIAAFGVPAENGNWPPHLHFQVILDMQGYKGDYPGVCRFSERDQYLANCPDPDSLLNILQHVEG